MMNIIQTQTPISQEQALYLAFGPSADGGLDQQGDLVITQYDQEGWIFVESAACVGSEGSGVWVDRNGIEHHGPGLYTPSTGSPIEVQRADDIEWDGEPTEAFIVALKG